MEPSKQLAVVIPVRHTFSVFPFMGKYESTRSDTIIEQLRQRKTYLNTTEVMSIIGVTRATLCGWVRSGSISAIRIGKDYKFDPSTVARWLEARQV
jgi:excisionase family DNA binding protein